MKRKIDEIVELGHPKSLIHRRGEPVDEIIDTEKMRQELNRQLATPAVSQRSELLAFKRFISNTPLVELEYYSDEEFTDAYMKANSC